jgi:Spy/CpxP family protein refolding chaperone
MGARKVGAVLGAIALVVVVWASAASAQMGKLKSTTPQQRADAQTEYMQSKLALTPDQTPKVAAINLEYAQQMEPILKGSDGPLVKMRAMRGIQDAKEGELQGVLTPEQFTQYQAVKEEMREKIEQKLEGAAGGSS